jgi:hypothetical protein
MFGHEGDCRGRQVPETERKRHSREFRLVFVHPEAGEMQWYVGRPRVESHVAALRCPC